MRNVAHLAYVGLSVADTYLAGRAQTGWVCAARVVTKPSLVPALSAAVPPAGP